MIVDVVQSRDGVLHGTRTQYMPLHLAVRGFILVDGAPKLLLKLVHALVRAHFPPDPIPWSDSLGLQDGDETPRG